MAIKPFAIIKLTNEAFSLCIKSALWSKFSDKGVRQYLRKFNSPLSGDLLPKNRSRPTPFWVLYKGEKETGVSIHFVEEGVDSGDIVVQEKYPVSKKDTFNTLVKKNCQIAPKAIPIAIGKKPSTCSNKATAISSKTTTTTLPTTPPRR